MIYGMHINHIYVWAITISYMYIIHWYGAEARQTHTYVHISCICMYIHGRLKACSARGSPEKLRPKQQKRSFSRNSSGMMWRNNAQSSNRKHSRVVYRFTYTLSTLFQARIKRNMLWLLVDVVASLTNSAVKYFGCNKGKPVMQGSVCSGGVCTLQDRPSAVRAPGRKPQRNRGPYTSSSPPHSTSSSESSSK